MDGFNPIRDCHQFISDVLTGTFSGISKSNLKFETPPDPKMGHIALSCFKLAASFKKNPQLIAKEIAALDFKSTFSSVNAVGPYVNFYLDTNSLSTALFSYLKSTDDYGNSKELAGKTMMIEFSSPNTNKPLHLGHGRNNTIGMVLSNLFEKCGGKVIKANLINDRGIHICKSMLAYKLFGENSTPKTMNLKGDHFVGEFYVKYNKASENNPDLEQQVREMLLKWEKNEPETLHLWEKMNRWVLDGFDATYRRMGVKFDRLYYEHELYLGGKNEVLKALQAGICVSEENGAVSIDLEDVKLGKKILIRNDGTSIYMTQDIYTTIKKFEDYPLDGSLFVVGNEQDHHFRMLFAILKKFGYAWADTCEHISYGMISLPEGSMKSRHGNVVDLDDLLDGIKTEARHELNARNQAHTPESLDATAEHIAQAAVKFMMLRVNAGRDFLFDPKESISFEGATGPYLQYTHARICSVLNKADITEYSTKDYDYQWAEDEGRVVLLLANYPNIIVQSVKERNPAILTTYIYEVAKLFNKCYSAYPIINAEESVRMCRLNLCMAVKHVLSQSMILMTIHPLTKM